MGMPREGELLRGIEYTCLAGGISPAAWTKASSSVRPGADLVGFSHQLLMKLRRGGTLGSAAFRLGRSLQVKVVAVALKKRHLHPWQLGFQD